ncbi:MAG: hypothetical protein ACYC9J_10920 [Sulfuricaulis sp.]
MAKAHIKKPDGTNIVIEGTPQEVAELVSKIEGQAPSKGKKTDLSAKRVSNAKTSLSDLLMLLIDEGFFKKPKELAAVKAALAERGHVYPVTTISPALLRIVRRRYLRRIKQDKRWFYTG